MLIQFLFNFFLATILLYYYLIKINFVNLLDKNLSGYGSKKKTKTAAGIIFSLIVLINFVYYHISDNYGELLPNRFYVFILSIFLLSLISFFDDIKSLDPRLRLIAQTIITYFSLTLINLEYFNLPLKLLIFLSLFFWIYITNITNFIDGSDGYLAVNAISVFLGLIIINQFTHNIFFSYHIAIILIPILLSFIYFNRPKAKLYMGDTGSILIGYILGFCLLELIFSEYWFIAIALYSYPIFDCTLTLGKKVFSGRNIFNRDFDYFFLIPIKKLQKNNFKVLSVSIIFNLLNLALVTCIMYFENPLLILISIILTLTKLRVFQHL